MNNNWNSLIAALPGAHVLQTWEWGQVKAQYGWQPHQKVWHDEAGNVAAAALVLVRAIPIRGFAACLSVAYVPKGPLLDWSDTALRVRVLADLRAFARKKGAIFLKIDPDVLLGTGIPGEANAADNPAGQAFAASLQQAGWHFSQDQIQFRNTVLLDLTPPEDEMLARMKQKTRYNIRLAGRKGVTVRVGTAADLELLYRMYAETAVRDGFVIRDKAYYLAVWQTFLQAGILEPLIAEVEKEPVAAICVFHFAGKAWYIYGMSRAIHRNKMPNYLLQWEAMRRAQAAGCTTYDLWGAPDAFHEGDPLWGVFRFKRGLGGTVARHLGAWDFPLRPLYYRFYTQLLPRLLDIMRRRGKTRTQQNIST